MPRDRSRSTRPAASGRRRFPRRPHVSRLGAWTPRWALLIFIAVPLVVLAAVAGGTVLTSERIARANALDDVEGNAARMATFLVRPLLADALAGVPGRWNDLDRVMGNRLQDGSISSVVIWQADGQVVWASDKDVVGRQVTDNDELQEALAHGVVSDVDAAPETASPGEDAPMVLEVYVPTTIGGEQFAIEAYYLYEGVEREARLLRGQLIPLAIGALVVLQLVQIPIAASLAGRLRRRELERAELTERSLTASEAERRAIAADLHDGPVQDLAGVGYALSGLRNNVPAERQPTMDRAIGAVRNAVHSLRRLMIDVYPPDLSGPGLATALGDLVQPVRDHGLVVDLTTGPLPDLSPPSVAVLYRSAKEVLANVVHHSSATAVRVRLELVGGGRPEVRLEVQDDGVGFADLDGDPTPAGHLGLHLVRDRVRAVGGRLEVANGPSGGAFVAVTVPVEPEGDGRGGATPTLRESAPPW
jgi:two-component system NarL family sensor kinase